ncbi:hypothetical protein niasHT_011874 [Heterodera trifolii]|uniref:Uncharacterized protein n=1 Tax=Heterodera trifolii TaxID=157864 RepID=A0ABD2KUX5_9BILA
MRQGNAVLVVPSRIRSSFGGFCGARPNGEYDGYTASEPRAESTRSQMMAEIACYYGGKIAELLFCVKCVRHGDDMREWRKWVLDTLSVSEWMEHEQRGEERRNSSVSSEEESVFEEGNEGGRCFII